MWNFILLIRFKSVQLVTSRYQVHYGVLKTSLNTCRNKLKSFVEHLDDVFSSGRIIQYPLPLQLSYELIFPMCVCACVRVCDLKYIYELGV